MSDMLNNQPNPLNNPTTIGTAGANQASNTQNNQAPPANNAANTAANNAASTASANRNPALIDPNAAAAIANQVLAMNVKQVSTSSSNLGNLDPSTLNPTTFAGLMAFANGANDVDPDGSPEADMAQAGLPPGLAALLNQPAQV